MQYHQAAFLALAAAALAPAECSTLGALGALRGGGWSDWGTAKPKLETDDSKALYALGCNVGRQLGDLDCFTESELETVLFGMKDVLTHTAPRVELKVRIPIYHMITSISKVTNPFANAKTASSFRHRSLEVIIQQAVLRTYTARLSSCRSTCQKRPICSSAAPRPRFDTLFEYESHIIV